MPDDVSLTRRAVLGAAVATGLDAIVAGRASAQESPLLLGGSPRVSFGAWVPGGQSAVGALQRKLGRKLDIVHWYLSWDDVLDVGRARTVVAADGIPMITWEPWGRPLRRIAAGHFDAYLRRNAKAIRAVPGTVWLRFAHEMNLKIYPWSVGGGTTAKDYVAAWRRVVRIFRAQGALNVRFVWSPNVLAPGSTPLQRVWPGEEYVDYLGMDGYNWGHAGDPPSWATLPQIFGGLYDELRGLSSRPIVISEVACADTGGNKARWIHHAFGRDLIQDFPAVTAVVWFNEDKEADWRLDQDAATLKAARAVFDNPPYVPGGLLGL